jgi:hypothetical protein
VKRKKLKTIRAGQPTKNPEMIMANNALSQSSPKWPTMIVEAMNSMKQTIDAATYLWQARRSRHARNIISLITKFNIATIIFVFSAFLSAQVPVTLLPMPEYQSFALNGEPNSFGCVFTYQTGTTTPLATYTDVTGLTQNSNPVVLSSAGLANIWIQLGQAYTITVKTSGGTNCATGSTIYSVNGIAGGSSQVVTTVTGTSPQFIVTAQNQLFTITLTANTVSLPLVDTVSVAPSFITFQITQDNVGSHTFAWPSNMIGTAAIGLTANQTTTQTFLWNGTSAFAIGPGMLGNGPILSAGSLINATVISSAFTSASANPSQSGILRLAATDAVRFRNTANSTDVNGLTKNNSDQVVIGDVNGAITSAAGSAPMISGQFTDSVVFPAASGQVRLGSSSSICWRNVANSADICITKNAADQLVVPSTDATLNKQDPTGNTTGNATDQTVYSYSLPGGVLGSGKCLDVSFGVNHVAGANSLTAKIKFGATTTIIDAGSTGTGGASSHILEAKVCNNLGSITAQWAQGTAVISGSAVETLSSSPAENTGSAVTILGTANVANPDTWAGAGFTVILEP